MYYLNNFESKLGAFEASLKSIDDINLHRPSVQLIISRNWINVSVDKATGAQCTLT